MALQALADVAGTRVEPSAQALGPPRSPGELITSMQQLVAAEAQVGVRAGVITWVWKRCRAAQGLWKRSRAVEKVLLKECGKGAELLKGMQAACGTAVQVEV